MSRQRTLLCVSNFPSGTGYAWNFIESLYAGLSDRMHARGIPTFVAYPALQRSPTALNGSTARPIEAAFRLHDPAGVARSCALVRRLDAGVLYLSDRPAWHVAYPLLRASGVRRIIVHDHISGERTRPSGVRRRIKRARNALPGALADQVLAVSDFVARRKMDVDLVPGSRIQTIWNSLEMPPVVDDAPGTRSHAIRRELGIAPSRTLIACACRASPPKGLDHLFRAFDRLVSGDPSPSRPALVYAGDGPALDDLRSLRARLAACEDIHILGYRDDAADLLGAADFAVVPSTWAEAFGLAALEPMSRGRPVIASRTGGLPEIVLDGETGLLVEPGDETALMTAMRDLAQDPERRDRMGRSARRRALELFSRDRQLDRLEELVLRGFEPG